MPENSVRDAPAVQPQGFVPIGNPAGLPPRDLALICFPVHIGAAPVASFALLAAGGLFGQVGAALPARAGGVDEARPGTGILRAGDSCGHQRRLLRITPGGPAPPGAGPLRRGPRWTG